MAWLSLACSISALLVLALPALAINEGLRDALYETCDPDARNIIAKIKIEGRPISHLYISGSLRRKDDIQMEMIISGCKEAINNRLANGLDLDINKEDKNGETFLMETTRYGLVEISKALISAGADVNKTTKNGASALMTAVRSGRPNITDLLLSAGADISYINRKNKFEYGYGLTILELANEMTLLADFKKHDPPEGRINYAADCANVVDVLKKHGASLPEFHSLTQFLESFGINLSEINDPLYRHGAEVFAATPLGFAAWYERKDAVKMLLDAGADVNAPSESQMKTLPERVNKALAFAVFRGSAEITKMLVDAGADVNTGRRGKPLESAARFGYSDVCKILIEAGADINDGALEAAAGHGHTEICQMLLDAGADVNKKDRHGRTALMAAGNRDTTELLLSAGADLNMRDDEGYTALHSAIRRKDYPKSTELSVGIGLGIAKMLIEAGADVNIRLNVSNISNRGETALETAARSGYVEICQMLLEAGAEPDNKVLGYAAASGHAEICQMLLNSGVDPNAGTLNNAVRSGNKDICQMMLDAGADIDSDALVQAARNGYTEICQLLLDAGADVNAQNNPYWSTALIVAGNMDIAKMLVSAGADLNIQNNFGNTALMSYGTGMDIAKMLISAGADLNKRNNAGYTAIYKALDWDRTDVARMLIEAGADVSLKPSYKDRWDEKKMTKKYNELETEIIKDKLRNGSYLNFNKEDANGVSFLMESVRDGDVEMSKLLISAGADVNKIALNGDSALLWAVYFDRPNITDLLLSAGADMNFINKKNVVGYGLTPIEIANYLAMQTVKAGRVIKYAGVVDVLKKHGATVPEFQNLTQILESFGISLAEVNETLKCRNVDIFISLDFLTPLQIVERHFTRFDYLTPLEIAARYGRTDGVKLLLEAGAETDNEALECAVNMNSTEITQMLLDAGADVNARAPYTVLVTATRLGYGNICKILLEAGAETDNRALEIAARSGNIEICQMLLNSGADPNDGSLNEALLSENKKEICQMLLDAGADVNKKDRHGETVLMNTRTMDMAELFISSGADLNIQDNHGNTALCWALWRSKKDLARMLIEAGADVNIKPEEETWMTPDINRTYAELEQEMNSQG